MLAVHLKIHRKSALILSHNVCLKSLTLSHPRPLTTANKYCYFCVLCLSALVNASQQVHCVYSLILLSHSVTQFPSMMTPISNDVCLALDIMTLFLINFMSLFAFLSHCFTAFCYGVIKYVYILGCLICLLNYF